VHQFTDSVESTWIVHHQDDAAADNGNEV